MASPRLDLNQCKNGSQVGMPSPKISHCQNGSQFEASVTAPKVRLVGSCSLPVRHSLHSTGGVQAKRHEEARLSVSPHSASTRFVIDCGGPGGHAMDKSSVVGSDDIRKNLEALKLQLRQDILTELREDVNQQMSKMQNEFDGHFTQCVLQLQAAAAERERKVQDIETMSHQKILNLEAAVVTGLDEIRTMSESLGEMTNELEEVMKQAMRPNPTLINSEIEADELKYFMQQLSEEKTERAQSNKLRDDIMRNFEQIQHEFKDAFGQVASLGAEREKQDFKILNLEGRLNLKISQLERTVAGALAEVNEFNQSPMALVSAREKKRMLGQIEEKLNQAMTGMETEITSLKGEVEYLHKEAHTWQETKKENVEQSCSSSSTQFDPSDQSEKQLSDPSDVSEDAFEDYFVSDVPTNSHIPFLILVP